MAELTVRRKGQAVSLVRGSKTLAVLGDAFLHVKGDCWRLSKGNLALDGVTTDSGEDRTGDYQEHRIDLIGDRRRLRFSIVLRCYEDRPVALIFAENNVKAPLFDTNILCGVTFARLPSSGSGILSHLRLQRFTEPDGYFFCHNTFLHSMCKGPEIDWGNLAIWRYIGDTFGCMLPITGRGCVSRIRLGDEGLSLVGTALDGTRVYERVPLGLFVVDEVLGEAIHTAFATAQPLVLNCPFRSRAEKAYPKPLEYLGWCSWHLSGARVSADALLAVARTIREADLPIRFILVDDGWQVRDQKGALVSFEANTRFPGGLEPLAWKLKTEYGIQYLGLWHALQGGWSGISRDSALYQRSPDHYWQSADGNVIPSPLNKKGERFYGEWYDRLKEWGVDFVKVDNQGACRNLFINRLPQDEATGALQNSLQVAAERNGIEIINSMSMHPDCYYHYHTSNVTRVSADYVPDDLPAAKVHLINSLYNANWLSEISYPDYDMFQTHHPAARAFAVLAALSGGPVYIADDPEKIDADFVRKLCTRDGMILRPDEPAKPLADGFFDDPGADGNTLKAVARCDDSTLLGVVNVTESGKISRGRLAIRRLPITPARRYLVWAHFAGRAKVCASTASLNFTLRELEAELFVVIPIVKGMAIAGLVDRLVSLKTVTMLETSARRALAMGLHADGKFLMYLESKRPSLVIDGIEVRQEQGTGQLPENSFRLTRNLLEANLVGEELLLRY